MRVSQVDLPHTYSLFQLTKQPNYLYSQLASFVISIYYFISRILNQYFHHVVLLKFLQNIYHTFGSAEILHCARSRLTSFLRGGVVSGRELRRVE